MREQTRSGIIIDLEKRPPFAVISIVGDDGSEVIWTVDTKSMDHTIWYLARCREIMTPAITGAFDDKLVTANMPSSVIAFGAKRDDRDRYLAIRDDAVGWVSCGLTDEQATRLAADLFRDVPGVR